MKPKQLSRDNFDFWTRVSTRWIDMDGLRHLNHAAYLSYMETARLYLYESLGYDMHRWDQKIGTILASMTVEYFGQATHPSQFDVGQRITRIGTKSFDISTAVFKDGENLPITQAVFILVTYDYVNNESILVPGDFRKHLHVS